MNVNEAIEKVGKDTQSVDLYADIPEVKPEDMKLQAVAPVSYVAAVEQSKKDRDKFFKFIEERKEAAKNALENTDESRFKRVNKSTGKSNLNVDQPGLKKMHLDESLFEIVDENYSQEEVREWVEFRDKLNSIVKKHPGVEILEAKMDKTFKVMGYLKDIKEFEKDYNKEFGVELNESLNESEYNPDWHIKDGDGWDYEFLQHLMHGGVFKDLEKLLYELQSGVRGIYSGAKKASELANYLRICAESLEGIADQIEDMDDIEPEDLDESEEEKLQESDWADRYYRWSRSTQAKLDKILSAGLFDELELDVMEPEEEGSPLNKITRFYSDEGWAITKEAYGGPNDEERKEISKALYDLIDIYYKRAQEKDKSKNENINESKKSLKEATIITDVKSFRPWGVAVDTYNKVKEEEKLDQLEAMIEEMYPEGIESQTFNDFLGYDQDFIYQMLNIKVEEE